MTPRRSLVMSVSAPSALLAAALLAGCSSMSLPEGYAWNVSPEKQNDFDPPRGSFRWGFDQSRINESLPATSRDRTAYDYAAVLPKTAAAPAVRPPYQPQATPAFVGSADPLYTALDPAPAPGSAPGRAFNAPASGYFSDAAVFTLPGPDTPVARGAFRAPATTEVRILGGNAPRFDTPDAAPGNSAGPRTHTVVKGDNYWDLAKQYYGQGARFQDIAKANPTKNPTKLQIGDTLVIPE